ncbi:MAG: hypothetical protein EBS51_10370 [Planctomycetia bacterium]|nr:hypothetical protein [Planctomycetia bacterium]
MGSAQDAKHLDTQFRPRALLAAVRRHGLPIDVQPKEQRQEHAQTTLPCQRVIKAEHHHVAEERPDHREHGQPHRVE